MSDNYILPNNISDFIKLRNDEKILFTAGPASLSKENILGLRACFGRDDQDYSRIENYVMNKLRHISGQENIVRLQGSASLALEIISLNFLYGKVLVVSTGFYSNRLLRLAKDAKLISKEIEEIIVVEYKDLENINGRYDWIISCYTETSKGFKISLKLLRKKANQLSSKIMLDATASIGLEPDHNLADVIGFSSCKGLFGLTGAAFIAYKCENKVNVNSFYLNLNSHIEKKMTGPYHSICSLYETLKKHNELKESVKINKKRFCEKFRQYLNIPDVNQPLICTQTKIKIRSKLDKAVLYNSRAINEGSIICHLGEVHLARESKGEIIKSLEIHN
tara:strand:+ start:68 stop:1072 length:1005 start_codon:yes stop_codon:yes gene_type:complete